MTDSGMKGRVIGLLGGPPLNEPLEYVDPPPGPTAQQQALQVLTMAQRTAEEHIAGARHEADRIRSDARASAEQIVRDAQAHAHGLQQEAEQALSDAHVAAEQTARDAQAHANNARRQAEEILSDAGTRADDMTRNAQAQAEELRQQARQRFEDVVGSLAAKREALQRQIEALEGFDREYRSRLTAFMQNQMRALWADEPRVNADELEPLDSEATPTDPPLADESQPDES